jgi:hypothetical protein
MCENNDEDRLRSERVVGGNKIETSNQPAIFERHCDPDVIRVHTIGGKQNFMLARQCAKDREDGIVRSLN